MEEENRVILIDKPAGMSSFQVVARVRGALKREFQHKVKVGHTGTLDPFATGLLILLSGKYTKKSGEFLKLDKEYIAKIKLGFVSDTGDIEGEISPFPTRVASGRPVATGGRRSFSRCRAPKAPRLETVKSPQPNTLKSVLTSFTGKIRQRPPKYSAIKINGQRAYKLARSGKEFEMPTREVEIYSLEMLEYKYPDLTLRCHVSSGTYIRTLAEDIGEALGVGAYCEELRRTRVGEYDVKDAVELEDFTT